MSNASTIQTGLQAESIAVNYLHGQGYAILKTNYRTRYGEIDIIAEKDDILVFIEVKSSARRGVLKPELKVNFRKQKRLVLTAQDYITTNEPPAGGTRFDVIVMLRVLRDEWKIEHIKDAFRPENDY